MPGHNTSHISVSSSHLFRNLLLAALLLSFWCTGAVQAATRYVKPSAEIPIRSGQGTEYKILAVVPDGMEVEIIEENDPWAMVRTPGGTEGWMFKRYLSDEPPLSLVVTSLREQYEKLKQTEADIRRKYDELTAAYSQNENDLNACILERDETKNMYLELLEDTADVIKIKKDLDNTALALQATRQELISAEEQNRQLKRNATVRWFLAGGGVLFFGILLGMLSSKSRRRKSSLY